MADTNTTPREPKAWGETECLFLGEFASLHRAWFRAGGYSSLHLHRFKNNTFIVESGTVRVEFYRQRMVAVTLGPGESLTIPSGILHRFRAIEDGCMLESYVADHGHKLDRGDIHRLDEGGMSEEQPESVLSTPLPMP